MRLMPPLRQQRDRDAIRAGARRRHDRRAGQRPHAGRRRRQEPAVRRGRAGRDRPRAAARPGAEVGRRRPGSALARTLAAVTSGPARVLGERARRAGRERRRGLVEGGVADVCVFDPDESLDGRRRDAREPGPAHAVRAPRDAGPRALHAGRRRASRTGAADGVTHGEPLRRSKRRAARAWRGCAARGRCTGCTALAIVAVRAFPSLDAAARQRAHPLVVGARCCACSASRWRVEGAPRAGADAARRQPRLVARHHGDPRGRARRRASSPRPT